jgi:phosphate transport system protein
VAGGEQGRQPIRGAQAQELEGPSARLVDLIRQALAAMRHATAALFGTDPPVADSFGAAYDALTTLGHELEDHAAVLLAARARLAVAELPATIAAAHINAEAERMGQLAREVADIARTRRAWASIPAPMLGVLHELSEVCQDMAAKAADVVESRGAVGVAQLDRGDEMDRLRQRMYRQLLSRTGVIDVDAAIDLTFAARCYERYAEHAVAVAYFGALLAEGAPNS